MTLDADDLRTLRAQIPVVVAILVRRGADFASAEDAVQSALVAALESPTVPRDLRAWLVTAAWRKFLDEVRSATARGAREARDADAPAAGEVSERDDTLWLYFLCAHPTLTSTSAVALTLRTVAGLTTREIADAYLVPESTMAQRISRAKQRIAGVRLDEPGDVATVLRVLYLMFTVGHSGSVDLAQEAIRITRQLRTLLNEPEVSGLLALMLLHHARRRARSDEHGRLIPLDEQDRSRWDRALIAEGVHLLQRALGRQRRGPFQVEAAIAALHADAATAAETDWPQIVAWYDDLLALAPTPVAHLNRAVAVGRADGPQAGLAALATVATDVPRRTAVAAYFHERTGETALAAEEYADAAARATNLAEQDHLARQAARLRGTSG
ncbi:RNA polymerase sigma factor [Microbacterium gorillae]|uniref:RNA polymerase sigma factor n=1 Tax=Microbacterium gorillae TaxID=1231063 RepID=UPI000A7C81F9|nr:DUF6596 domain-containing protein [Microbacterium gorillae]